MILVFDTILVLRMNIVLLARIKSANVARVDTLQLLMVGWRHCAYAQQDTSYRASWGCFFCVKDAPTLPVCQRNIGKVQYILWLLLRNRTDSHVSTSRH